MAKIKKTGRHTSAIKAARQAVRHQAQNIKKKQKIKGCLKAVLTAMAAKDKAKTEETFRKYISEVDKSVKIGLLHWRTGARKKSNLWRRIKQPDKPPVAKTAAPAAQHTP